MRIEIISEEQIANRKHWVDEISKLSGDFGGDSERVEQELSEEIRRGGMDSLIGHLRPSKIEGKERAVQSVSDRGLLEVE